MSDDHPEEMCTCQVPEAPLECAVHHASDPASAPAVEPREPFGCQECEGKMWWHGDGDLRCEDCGTVFRVRIEPAVEPREDGPRTVQCPICRHSHSVLTAGEIGKIRRLRARLEAAEGALREIETCDHGMAAVVARSYFAPAPEGSPDD